MVVDVQLHLTLQSLSRSPQPIISITNADISLSLLWLTYDSITYPVVGAVGVTVIVNALTASTTQLQHVLEALGDLCRLIDDAARPSIDFACCNYFRSLLKHKVGPHLLSALIFSIRR
jgi:hypothetical protein